MEQNVKKRDWVKNAAIIFLAVLLVLTFFSNTILNRTLPEVVTRYVEPGSIDAKVRVRGTVSARENYDVIIDQTRKVASVVVRVGQQVSTGDVLFTLENTASDELEQAKKTLESLQMDYQRALLTATSADYARENRDIALTRTELDAAKAKLEGVVFVSQEALDAAAADVAAAETYLKNAKDATKYYTQELKSAQYGADHSSSGSGWNGGGGNENYLAQQVSAAQETLNEAKNTLNAAKLAYGADYETVKTAALAEIAAAKPALPPLDADETAYVLAAVDAELSPAELVRKPGETDSDFFGRRNRLDYEFVSIMPYYTDLVATRFGAATVDDPVYGAVAALHEMKAAYDKVLAAKNAFTAAQDALTAAQNALSDAASSVTYDGGKDYDGKPHSYWEQQVATFEKKVMEAQEAETAAQTALDTANAALEKLKADKAAREAEYAEAQAEVARLQRSLEDQLFSLAQQQKSDGRSQALEALSRQELQAQIAEAEKKVEELSGASDAEVKAKVNGTVTALSVSAGHKAEAGQTLATIEVDDLGFTMTATVSLDQARLLHVGDTANVSNYYWGSKTTAVINSIKPDPKDPRTSRVLTFDVAGDVNAGDQLSFAIGEKNASYDLVVPNSAVRSDSNGSFVLMITAKNSPLGNRYFATRVDVEVIASDDYNSAIKGELSNMDSVVTTSSGNAPVKNGDQVRLADMNA